MTILYLEDEKLAAQKIINLLNQYFDDPSISWFKSAGEGLHFLQNNPQPDLIVSDIELLDGSVFSLFTQISIASPIVFTTAYDQFLLQAFQTNGIAYLLKPFDEHQFNETLDKYQKLFNSNDNSPLSAHIIQDLKEALFSSKKEFKTRFTIKKRSGIFLLNTSQIVSFKADGDLVYAIEDNGKKHIIQYRLSELEEILDPNGFFRINRSDIIHINFIEKMETFFNNRLVIYLKNVKEGLKTSTSKTANFRKWLDK